MDDEASEILFHRERDCDLKWSRRNLIGHEDQGAGESPADDDVKTFDAIGRCR